MLKESKERKATCLRKILRKKGLSKPYDLVKRVMRKLNRPGEVHDTENACIKGRSPLQRNGSKKGVRKKRVMRGIVRRDK